MLSIITPTYNRAHLLGDLALSIDSVSNICYEWIIVDDGSTDNTKEVVDQFQNIYKFNIKYFYQTNAGKPSAVNNGIIAASGRYLTIIDSDDLAASGLEACLREFDIQYFPVASNLNICGFSGLCANIDDGSIVGLQFPSNNLISNHIEMRINKNIIGDKNEVFITNILKKYLYPILGNEKFITEALVWNRIGAEYSTVYYNHILIYTRYQINGLTSQGDKLYKENPLSATLYFSELYQYKINLKPKILAALNYYKYFNLCKSSSGITKKFKIIYILGLIASIAKKLK